MSLHTLQGDPVPNRRYPYLKVLNAYDRNGRVMIPANLKNKSFDMADWKPMFALPNILVQEPIEVDGFALVPAADERIRVVQTERPLCVRRGPSG